MIKEKEEKNFNLWNDRYRKHNDIRKFLSNSRAVYEKIADIIFTYRHNKIIDFGSGIGVVPHLLKKRKFNFDGREYVCVDYSRVALEKTFIKEVIKVNRDIKDIEYKEDYYDIALCVNVLEYIKDYVVVLKKAFKMLNDSGILITSSSLMSFDKLVYYSKIDKNQFIDYHEATGFRVIDVILRHNNVILVSTKKIEQHGDFNNERKKINLRV